MRLFLILLVYTGLCSCSTSSFFYYPSRAMSQVPDTLECSYEEVNFASANGSVLNGWFIRPKDGKPSATVLFFHGNGANISLQFGSVMPLVRNGFQVLVFDYQGYGKSQGTPSQEKVLEDGISALYYIRSRMETRNLPLLLYGQSLGGHLAVVVAARYQQQLDALIIEGAFASHEGIARYAGKKHYRLPGFVVNLLVPSRYDAVEEIGSITLPKLIIHSAEDKTVPVEQGRLLYEKAAQPKEFREIKGGHIRASSLYTSEFVGWFKELAAGHAF
jgi:uncharacterized protein